MRAAGLALLAALAAPLSLAASPAAAQVRVTFVAPERYTDAQNRFGSGPSLRVVLAEMRRLFETLGDAVLAPGQALDIAVLDIDLAGLDQPSFGAAQGVRVVTDITPPRFRLRYALKERGRTVLAAEETVSDINFLLRATRLSSGQTFFYEREVLRDWFQARFVQRRPPPG
ncbi:DUF3016 domain-containing protein [Methylorubrum populi]|jgi:hypothetical protein|uniref:DUF3016 domain-containing protein n=1 Tax=Methylorubrum rhodesianum TaxID=29427 RepID=A0ABU9ZJE7_9HYPH|nr:DUF3016 domain-containing protein [Methylorubrum rhodesianum]MBK3401356.1 DUF3016 domain-containing protein [Methylorubrum rhodesianum]MBY0140990.1 DUF3016 domain-containing protein [Methylorubrum populi]